MRCSPALGHALRLTFVLLGFALFVGQCPARLEITQVGVIGAGGADQIAVTRLGSRVITAVRTTDGSLKVIVWEVASNGALTRLGDGSAGGIFGLAITDWPQGPGVITAVRTTTGLLKVIAWKIASDGTVTRAGDATGEAVLEVAISSPGGFGGVVTPVRTALGNLKVIAWSVSSLGTVTQRGDASGLTASQIVVTAVSSAGGNARVATGFRNGPGNLEIITWSISPSGTVARLHEAGAGPITDLAITYRGTDNADLITVSRGASDDLTTIGWRLNDDGSLNRLASAQGGDVGDLSVVTVKPDLHSYIVAAIETGSSQLKLIAWRNGGDLKRHGELDGGDIQEVAATTWSGGVVTATSNADGNLRVTSFRVSPTGIKLLHREWPAPNGGGGSGPGPDADQETALASFVPDIWEPDLIDDLLPRYVEAALNPDGYTLLSAGWRKKFFPNVSGVDPMIAVGHQYVIVSQDHQFAFLDREGNPLPSKAGEPVNMSATTFFKGFLSTTNADGSANLDNINLYSPLQIKEFYDSRVVYDASTRRFALLSAAREKGGSPPPRYIAFAVSKTEDPRDGFHQYMTTESNYRDFPRLAIHGDRLLDAHNAGALASEGETPVLYAFHLPSLRQGDLDPPNWQYYASDLNGAHRVFLANHHGDSGGLTLLFDIRRNDPKLRIPAFPLAGAPGLAPTPIFAEVTLPEQAPSPGPHGVYRNQALWLAGNVLVEDRVPNLQPPRHSVRRIRIPFSTMTTSQLTVDQPAVQDHFFGLNAPSDAPGDKVSYDKPSVAVNANGDAIYVYGRTGVETKQPLFPEVRYSFWFHGETAQRRSTLLQAGSYQPTRIHDGETTPTSESHAYKLDYSTAVVDPVNDQTFWVIHEYSESANAPWKTVVGVIDPWGTRLLVKKLDQGLSLSWALSSRDFILERAHSLDGPWEALDAPYRTDELYRTVDLLVPRITTYYRLVTP